MLKKNNTIDRMVEILAIFLNEFASSTILTTTNCLAEVSSAVNALNQPITSPSSSLLFFN